MEFTGVCLCPGLHNGKIEKYPSFDVGSLVLVKKDSTVYIIGITPESIHKVHLNFLIEPTMFQNAHNVMIYGGSFTTVHEQTGMTGASSMFEPAANPFPAYEAAKVSRYCMEGVRMVPPMTPPNICLNATQRHARRSLVTL